jgi:hypothetical protein
VATVLAAGEVTGWVGRDDAFDTLIELPGVLNTLVRTARQRMAAFITPIPIHLADGTELLLRPVLPGDSARPNGARLSSRRKRCSAGSCRRANCPRRSRLICSRSTM